MSAVPMMRDFGLESSPTVLPPVGREGNRPGKALSVRCQRPIEIDDVAESLSHGGVESGKFLVDGGAVLGTHVVLQAEQ